MDFGQAIRELKAGSRVAREGWNGKHMFIIYVPGTPNAKFSEGTPYYKALENGGNQLPENGINPHIDMYTATGEFQPGWLASQTDMLADDWEILVDREIIA